jgi:hypothetical protein
MQPQHVPRPLRCGIRPSRRSRSQLSISTAFASIQSLSRLHVIRPGAASGMRAWLSRPFVRPRMPKRRSDALRLRKRTERETRRSPTGPASHEAAKSECSKTRRAAAPFDPSDVYPTAAVSPGGDILNKKANFSLRERMALRPDADGRMLFEVGPQSLSRLLSTRARRSART